MPRNAAFVASYSDLSQIPNDNLPQIAFAGRSNVGKSSLLNRLVMRKGLAKTSKTPGRTRLLNFFVIDDSFYFVDLPGYGYAKVPLKAVKEWGFMVNKYLEESPQLKALLLLLDCRRDPNEDDLMLYEWVKSRNIEFAIALTKVDKLTRNKMNIKQNQISKILKATVIPFSSVSGIGVKELWKWIDTVKQ